MMNFAFPWRRAALVAMCALPVFLLFQIFKSDTYGNNFPSIAGAGRPTKTSQVHYLMPASSPNDMFCAVVASALVNRYPAPYIVGWRGEGQFNATSAHTAKLYSLRRYLEDLPQGGSDDDLVIFGDGHDVMAQLPADVLVERYFAEAEAADRRLADRSGLSVEEARARGLRQTLFWGADKMCWPPLHDEAQCAEVPRSHLPRNIFGPKTGNGDSTYADARFFNSGSVIGPLGDLRKFIEAGVRAVEKTFDSTFKYHSSDQIYLARLWAQQEVSRTLLIKAGAEEENADETEYHVAIDYESALVQTGCYSHPWMHRLNYNNSDHTALVTKDVFDQGKTFKPLPIQMPAVVFQSLARIYKSLPDLKYKISARDWVGSLPLDTNVATRNIFAFYHATCSKRDLVRDFKRYWFHPHLKLLLAAAFRETKAGTPIAERLIDGRRWEYKTTYPDEGARDQLGGVFTDHGEDSFLSFGTLCKGHWDLFKR
ncbi:hypothetical protein F5X68DRAFT_259416 [Plectosphaerella plurivora]|uniref:Uncharacterized protein n=1 Tax=Plectosphaerella plurivora TaxID=936078 RepID=A0A9P8VIE4_9PEZI|nr:hypothetical protein F5X68DRAFT_259416 [Plectosphaerella plurivora]